jgi:hypothetical protein
MAQFLRRLRNANKKSEDSSGVGVSIVRIDSKFFSRRFATAGLTLNQKFLYVNPSTLRYPAMQP